MILLLDNYDSFTYNLQDYILQLGEECRVIRNDEFTTEEISADSFDSLVISPGPKTPKDAGITMQMIEKFYLSKPILGICLGHQAIGEFFGATLEKAQKPMHGKTSVINCEDHFLFKDLLKQLEVMRYHSLILKKTETTSLKIIAQTNEHEIMAIAHKSMPIAGLQFHPESVLTKDGLTLLRNWFNHCNGVK